MRFEEALSAMRDGKKVRCKYWVNPDYYLIIEDKNIVNYVGCYLRRGTHNIADELLRDDWEIFGEEEKQEAAADTTTTLKSYEAKLLWEEIERLKTGHHSLVRIYNEIYEDHKCVRTNKTKKTLLESKFKLHECNCERCK